MKPLAFLFVYLAAAAAFAQTAPAPPAQGADEDPNAVIATFEDGKQLTNGELKTYMGTLPPQMQQAAMRDRKNFISQYALMRRLTKMAEQNKLFEQSPTREMLEFSRMQVLTNAQLNDTLSHIKVPAEDIKAFYDSNRDRFSQVSVKALYISFVAGDAAAGGKKSLREPEARLKIEALLKQIRGGADFVKMVRQHSEDQTSAAKDGDFGNLRRGDNLPDAVRNAIFSLKQGEVSEPVRQPNGFYLFRAEKVYAQPFEQVRDEIFNELREKRFREWMEETQRAVNAELERGGFQGLPAPKVIPPASAK